MASIPEHDDRYPRPRALALINEKLRFLKGNLRLLLFWPAAAILLTALGWKLLFLKLDEDRSDAQRFAQIEAATLARSYAEDMKRIRSSAA